MQLQTRRYPARLAANGVDADDQVAKLEEHGDGLQSVVARVVESQRIERWRVLDFILNEVTLRSARRGCSRVWSAR